MRARTLAYAAALCVGATSATAQTPGRPDGANPSPAPTSASAPAAPGTAVAPSTTQARALTLPEAIAIATGRSAIVRSKQAQLDAAQGLVEESRAWLANNPQLTTEGTRRDVPSADGTDRRKEWNVGLSQTLEIAGQPSHRKAAAEANLQALRLEIDAAVAEARSETSQRFYRVLALQQRVEIESQALAIFDDTGRAVERRRAAGEDTRLDANVARVEAERARNQLASVQEQLAEARAELAATLQLSPTDDFVVRGDLVPAPIAYDLTRLQASAAARPSLSAMAAREQSAQERLALQSASRYPDITVGLSVGREGPAQGRERLTTLSVSVPLPLFKRNAAGVGQASSDLAQARLDREVAQRDSLAQVSVLWMKLQSLRSRIDRLQASVLPTLADNERLSVKSRQVGQIGLLELLVTTRQSLDARRDLVDALLDYQTTRVALELSSGWIAQP